MATERSPSTTAAVPASPARSTALSMPPATPSPSWAKATPSAGTAPRGLLPLQPSQSCRCRARSPATLPGWATHPSASSDLHSSSRYSPPTCNQEGTGANTRGTTPTAWCIPLGAGRRVSGGTSPSIASFGLVSRSCRRIGWRMARYRMPSSRMAAAGSRQYFLGTTRGRVRSSTARSLRALRCQGRAAAPTRIARPAPWTMR